MKTCSRCAHEKPLEAFYTRRGQPWGAICKTCLSRARRERYLRDRDVLLARVKDDQRRVKAGEVVPRKRATPGNVEGARYDG